MSDASGDDAKHRVADGVEQMDTYRTGPLRFPLHVLDEEGEALCGSMAEDQEEFIEQNGLEGQHTLRESMGLNRLSYLLSNLCGNCRRSLLSEDGTEELREAWEKYQRRQEVRP